MTLEEGRYFQFVERTTANDPINTKNKRYFGPMYTNSLPCSSGDQELICMPRFNPSDESSGESIIDVYDCAEEEFWLRIEPLDTTDEKYKCSLRLQDNDKRNYKEVKFSYNNRYVCV